LGIVTPLEIAGNNLWLDASDAATITLSSTSVTQWDDKSGNGIDVVQATNRPTLVSADQNGLDVISFDGTNDNLTYGGNALIRNVSSALVFVVRKWATEPTATKVLLRVNTSAAQTGRLQFSAGTTSKKNEAGGRRADSNSYVVTTGSADCGTAWNIQSAAYDYANSDLYQYIDGTVIASSTSFQTNGTTANTQSSGLFIGMSSNSTSFANAKIAEIIIVHNDVTTDTREKLEGYLAWKWGLEANLPTGHTYESAPPTIPDPEFTASTLGILDMVSTAYAQFSDVFSQSSVPGILDTVSNPKAQFYLDYTTSLTGLESEYYVMDLIDGDSRIRIPISSWQGTVNAGNTGYLQCVIPRAEDWVDAITAATGFIVFRKAYINGAAFEIELARATFTDSNPPTFYTTTSKSTCTLAGVVDAVAVIADPDPALDRILQNIRSITVGPGGRRVRAKIDLLLKPGIRAYANGVPMIPSYINYYGTLSGAYMDVGESG